MTNLTKRFATVLLCIFASVLAACSGSGGGVDNPSQPVPPPTGDTGYLNLGISDAPIKDAAKVCIRFDGVELKHADSEDTETIDFDPPQVINLLSYQGSDSHPIVTGAELPAGEYQWIRLKVQAERGMNGGVNDADPSSEDCDAATENSYLVRRSTGGTHNLFIPSGSQRGLQLIKDIIIPVNRTGDYTAEWDLRKSFNGPPGLDPDVMMKPVVKLVANNEVGTLAGQVADDLITLASCDAEFAQSVYVFDDGVTPNPLDDPFEADDAIATALVEQQEHDGMMQWRYTVGFLLTGNYEVAYTCNGNDFIPLAGKPAEVPIEPVTYVDFEFNDAPGTLVGQVASAFFDPEAPESGFCDAGIAPAVYVFGEGVVPNFNDAPVATGAVELDTATDQYRYSIPLQMGTYNAAFICNDAEFIPLSGKSAEIQPAAETMMDFLTTDAPAPVGSLSGMVESGLVTSESCAAEFAAAVYVFNEGVTPNGTDEPVATGLVVEGSYLIEDLLADTYTAAYTCTGTDFVPVAGKAAVIEIGVETPLSFTVADLPASE